MDMWQLVLSWICDYQLVFMVLISNFCGIVQWCLVVITATRVVVPSGEYGNVRIVPSAEYSNVPLAS